MTTVMAGFPNKQVILNNAEGDNNFTVDKLKASLLLAGYKITPNKRFFQETGVIYTDLDNNPCIEIVPAKELVIYMRRNGDNETILIDFADSISLQNVFKHLMEPRLDEDY